MKLTRYRRSSPFSYALGATLVFELLKVNPDTITRVFLRPALKHGEDLEKLLAELQHRNIAIVESTKAFNILGAKDSCLVIAEFKKTPSALDHTPQAPHIVLVNPSDSGNLGTIMRTAVAFGYANLAIIAPAVDHFDPKTIRASMGAIFHLNVELFPSFDDYHLACNSAQKDTSHPRTFYSFMLNQQSQLLSNIQTNGTNFSLIFGNEASGLPDYFADITQTIFIPQTPLVDSLNLAIAAGIGMYHFRTDTQ